MTYETFLWQVGNFSQLSQIRYILQIAMEKQLSNQEYDEFIEKEVEIWKPPYDSSKEELLDMIRE